MNRNEVLKYVKEKYQVIPDYPWKRTPAFAILRHRDNRKWFAAVLDISKDKLGLTDNQLVDVINLKCEPVLIGSLVEEPGIFPGYHMNKEHWITILLDGSVKTEKICTLIDLSYQITLSKNDKLAN